MKLPDPCTVAEAARWLGVSTQAVRLRIKSEKLESLSDIGAPILLAATDIEAWHTERVAAAKKVIAK